MREEQLKEILLDQREDFFSKRYLIDREIDLSPYMKSRQIVVISGIRRCGKSSLLYIIREKLNRPTGNCLYFNFDDERIASFEREDFNRLYQLHLELFQPESPSDVVFFFDEIQNTKGWEQFLSRMYERNIKIYITGSNATLLSSEIATSLTGRNLVVHLYPFSFKEYLRFMKTDYDLNMLTTGKKAEIKSCFNEYIAFGGFPLVALEKDLNLIKAYYQDILYRDIIARYKISHTEELKQLSIYLMSNAGKLFSYKTLLKITGIKSLSTVKNYLEYFKSSYLLYYLKKYDYSVKKQIMNPQKVYSSDIAFCSQIGFRFSNDYGRMLENIVFLELKRRRSGIFYHKERYECDFVCQYQSEISDAIQVSMDLSHPETEKREKKGLIEAMKKYKLSEGLILTDHTTDEETNDRLRIIIRPLWKWLLDKQS